MRAALDDAAVVHYENLIGFDDGGEAMGDDERGVIGRDIAKLGQYRLLRFRIQRRGRLVEDQDARIFVYHPRDRHALLLAARELEAARTDLRLVALRQRFNDVVDVGHLRGAEHCLARGVRLRVANVVVERGVEQDRVLRHDADGGAQALLRDVADVLAVDQYPAAVHVIEAEQQAGEGGFAGAAVAHHRDLVAGGNVEVDVEQYLPLRRVAK